ncbi:MAG: outer membrane lipoprotein-sorting protein [Deltaproteobacteria bacterium RBG_13_52_11b]|nr:MAG: outer membrane lipoprotein-sorting protein [Deltaproteobacteria bacterium RBG_13_52_11b]
MKTVFQMSLLLFWMTMAAATALFAQTDNDRLNRIDAKLMPESYESYRRLIDEYPDGKKKEFTVFSVKKGLDKVALLFLAPASEKGRTTLRLGENMWLYIPNVGKPIRITSLQSVTGGVFNNSDIMQVDYSAEYDVLGSENSDRGYLLELKAKDKTVAYDKLKMWAGQDDVVIKIECYAASGMLIKTLDFKEPKDFGNGLLRPSVIETYSPLYKGYRSSMVFLQIKSREFKDEVFTMNYMSRIETLRK